MSRLLLAAAAVLICTFNAAVADEGEREVLKSCLAHWGKHPFNAENFSYQTIAPSVKVFGIGGDVADTTPTDKPQLVLIKSSVNVFSKGTYRLLNPNGWYCLHGKVAVGSKVEIQLHCKAQLASSDDGATVMGSNDQSDGVTVMGKSEVKRVGCADGKQN